LQQSDELLEVNLKVQGVADEFTASEESGRAEELVRTLLAELLLL